MIGKKISHYKIMEKIGAGGMCVVYKAEDTKLKRTVALKFLPPELTRDSDAKARFIREAQAASSLQHNNICTIHDIDETADGQLYIIMDCYEGETLKDKIQSVGGRTRTTGGDKKLKTEEAVEIANQIADGLARAHEEGIVHRDIKPANIIITDRGEVKILDFGLAKLAGQAQLTKDSSTLGTVAYMSPEQVGGKEIDQRTDIWSLGVVLYEMLTGELPFAGEYEQAIMYAILNEEPKPLNNISSELQDIVKKALCKNPIDRYKTTEELLVELRKIKSPLHNHQSDEINPPKIKSFLNYKFAILTVITLVVIAIFTFLYFTQTERSTDASTAKRLVVLPFENLGAEEDQYFADGITDEITARLSNIREIAVIARTSAMQYKKQKGNIEEIGSDLDVDYILEGTVRWQHSSDGTSIIRVTPKLIRVSNETQVWVNSFDEIYSEIFKLQSNIARQVVEALDITLIDREQNALDSKPTENLEAYDYYLRGLNFERGSYTRENYTAAIKMYKQAINIDSSFALAWAQLAFVHTEMYWFDHDRSQERLVLAEGAINQAININPNLPEVKYALGNYFYHGKRDYKKALEQFLSSQKYLPNDSRIVLSIGSVLKRLGKFNETLANYLKAIELDPKNAAYLFETAIVYYYIKDYNKAERFLNQAISLAPDWPTPYHFKALLYLSSQGSKEKSQQVYEEALLRMSPIDFISKSQMSEERTLWKIIDSKYLIDLLKTTKEDFLTNTELYFLFKAELYDRLKEPQSAYAYYDSARVVFENKVKKINKDASIHIELALSYSGLGEKNKAIEEGNLALELLPMSKDAATAPLIIQYFAQILTNVGEYNAAIDRLEVLVTIKSSRVTIPWLRVDPTWDKLRDNPRFQELVR